MERAHVSGEQAGTASDVSRAQTRSKQILQSTVADDNTDRGALKQLDSGNKWDISACNAILIITSMHAAGCRHVISDGAACKGRAVCLMAAAAESPARQVCECVV